MKHQSFIIFFIVFFTIYFSVNYYIFSKGWQALPNIHWLKITYSFIFLLLSFAFILGRFIENTSLHALTNMLIWVGAFWLGAVVYFLMAAIICDLIRLVNILFHFMPLPGSIAHNYLKIISLLTSIIFVSVLLIVGHIIAVHPDIKHLEIKLSKKILNNDQIKIAAVSDIHLGILVGKERLNKLVKLVNSQNPDIIILAGNILDEVQSPILRENIGKPLLNLACTYGNICNYRQS